MELLGWKELPVVEYIARISLLYPISWDVDFIREANDYLSERSDLQGRNWNARNNRRRRTSDIDCFTDVLNLANVI